MENVATPVDNVNHPRHYEGSCSLECIEAMEVLLGRNAVYDFCLCNAFKYMWRFKNKNGVEDLNKAHWYLNYVERLGRNDMSALDILEVKDRLENLWLTLVNKENQNEQN